MVPPSDRAAPPTRVGALAELGLMTAMLAHEQRQPLFAIKSIAQLLAVRAELGAQPLFAQLLEQVALLERVVENISVYARTPAGRPSPVDLGQVVRTSVGMLEHQARAQQLALVVEVDPALCAVSGDSTALVQVLVNLLRNAIDASPPGARVQVSARSAGGGVRLEVRDEGPGVPEALREQVFEPFFTTKPPGKGTGLGLGIARDLSRACGGELSLAPDGPGLGVWVDLQAWPPLDAGGART